LCSARTVRRCQAQAANGSSRLQAAEHRFGDNTVAILVAGRFGAAVVGRIWDAGSETHVWTPSIVVSHPLRQYAPHLALVERNHEVETDLASRRADFKGIWVLQSRDATRKPRQSIFSFRMRARSV